MKKHKYRGYTLIELMITVVLIGVVAAIAVPQMMGVTRRTELSESVDQFQRTIADARALAMKTRRAVVVEVRTNSMWVNILSGTTCDSAIDNNKRCFNLGESNGAAVVPVEFMCDLRIASYDGSECKTEDSLAGTGVGICYNGSGQMWIRSGVDTTADCTPVAGATPNLWLKACAPWISSGGINTTASTWFSGADVRFNRGVSACPAGSATPAAAEDVTRRVMVPAGGHPYIKQVSSAND